MGFTIKQIKALLSDNGMPTENITSVAEDICSRHSTDLDAIKEERDNARKDAETLATVQKELDDLKKANGKDTYKVKYDALKKEYDDYKADVDKEKTIAEKQSAYKALLKELKISDTIIDKVVKLADLDSEEMADGKFKNETELKKTLGEEWKDFIVENNVKGAQVQTPPETGATKKTMADIYKKDDHGRYVLSAAERQAELAKNMSDTE